MRACVVVLLLVVGLSTSPVLGVVDSTASGLSGHGVVLPIQDRTGSPDTVAFLELLVRQEASQMGSLMDATPLRDILRRLRIREVTTAPPRKLDQLANELDASWYLSTTLHELASEPFAQVTMSAQIFRRGDLVLAWSGFVSLTGLDSVTWLGLGGVESLEDLLRTATSQLFEDLLIEGQGPKKTRLKSPTHGFLLEAVPPDFSTLIAVVPFNSVVDRNPQTAAEILTRASLAALHRAGFGVVLPGAVNDVMRQRGSLLLGEVDHSTAEVLKIELGAKWILTGTVETYQPSLSLLPDPWVAFGVRVVQSANGQIHWMDGMERLGSDSDVLFQQRRIYSAANLSFEMTRSLISGLAQTKHKN